MKFRNAFFLLGPLVFVAFGFYTKHQDLGEDILLRAINVNLQNAHYDPISIDDAFSEKAFQLYIDNLDANKRLFLQSDIDELNYFIVDKLLSIRVREDQESRGLDQSQHGEKIE
ncbi:hypothetical protein OAN98_05955 [Bacteroidia bacterium]|nr:hypothetical protein [Bacteroidia bacterium]